MNNQSILVDAEVETVRQHALEMANRATLLIAMGIWVAGVAAYFTAGASWKLVAGVVPMIPLIWHGIYLHIKRSRREAAAQIDTNMLPGQTDRRHGTPGHSKPSGRDAIHHPPDAPASSISLLLP